MKILFVQDSLGTGGAERSNALSWYFLRDNGIQIRIVVLEHRNEGVEEEIIKSGFEVCFVKSKGFISQAREIGSNIREFNPDIVQSVLIKSSLRVRYIRSRISFFHVESLVNCTYDPIRLRDSRISKPAFYYYKYLERFTQHFVDRFLAITETVKTHYINELQIPSAKIETIFRGRYPNPYLVEREKYRKAIRKELKLPDDAILVIHVGRQEFQKGHMILLKTVEVLNSKNIENVYFLLLGRKGNATNDIEAYTEGDRLPNVFWMGHQSDVQKWMVGSDIFVFPSLYEGLGGALIEAQSAALPVVCSDIPVFHEIVEEGVSAEFFVASDFNDLSKKLNVLIQDKGLRNEYGKQSLRIFNERFHVNTIHQELLEFYRNLIK